MYFNFKCCVDLQIEDEKSRTMNRNTTKRRRMSRAKEQKMLHLLVEQGRTIKKSFLLFDDHVIFKSATSEMFKKVEKSLIHHDIDNDCDTDEEMVRDHIKCCKDELKERVNEIIKGDVLKLIRNVRGEYSGIETIEVGSDHGNSTISSYYEVLDT